jgi:type III pantothenate kinase
VNLSLEALHMAAAALPHVDISKPQKVVGTNTVACMQSGIFWGYVGLVKECCARIAAERGQAMRIVATGGLAPLFQESEDLFDVYEDDLTMHGLTVIHSFNKGGT